VDRLQLNNTAEIFSTTNIDFTLPSLANFKANTKRILTEDDIIKQPYGALQVANIVVAELTNVSPVPFVPGVFFDYTAFADYILLTTPGVYQVCFANQAVNTDIQFVRVSLVDDATLVPIIDLDSALGNHTLVGVADARIHHYPEIYVSAPTRLSLLYRASKLAPGNVETANSLITVQCIHRQV